MADTRTKRCINYPNCRISTQVKTAPDSHGTQWWKCAGCGSLQGKV